MRDTASRTTRTGEQPPPLVSVIMPTYNRGRYIVEAIESVLSQDGVALDPIVIDDGSTDDTRARLAPYRDRVRYIAQENAGVSAARNRGMREARGQFIAFLDSDDVWKPGKLAGQVRFLLDHPDTGLICSDFDGFTDDGAVVPSYIDVMFPEFAPVRGQPLAWFERRDDVRIGGQRAPVYSGNVFDIMVRGYFTLTSTVVMRAEVARACGGFDERLDFCEDYDYYLRVSRQHRVAYVDLPTTRYRRGHGDQLSGGAFGSTRHIKGLTTWLALAERIRREDPGYYRGHRRSLDRIIAERQMWLGHARFHAGEYATAAQAFRRAIRNDPTRPRLYGYYLRARLRAGEAVSRR